MVPLKSHEPTKASKEILINPNALQVSINGLNDKEDY